VRYRNFSRDSIFRSTAHREFDCRTDERFVAIGIFMLTCAVASATARMAFSYDFFRNDRSVR